MYYSLVVRAFSNLSFNNIGSVSCAIQQQFGKAKKLTPTHKRKAGSRIGTRV